MIITKNEIKDDNIYIWSKTKNLKKLVDFWFLVPDFIAIPSNIVEIINNDNNELKKLCQIIITKFPQSKYIVRSSALIEDQINSSMAGQFHTEINVDKFGLDSAIEKVINQAKTLLKNDLTKLSIIVQEYIEADYSWVCFTRNPNWQREIVFDYHKWIGEDIVSWKIIPINETFYWNENKKICSFDITIFKNIENKFSFPQDIEWGIKKDKLYILQTRPITTISKNDYDLIIFLEENLNYNYDFCYEKTEISEVAPRPTPFTLSLLQKIFWENWPVMNVYKKHKILYKHENILKIVGNELFINRNLEIKTLLPCLSCLNKRYTNKFSSFNHFFRTIKNIFFIAIIKEEKNLVNKLESLLYSETNKDNFSDLLNQFLEEYETILEIDLFTSKYFKSLEIFLKNEPINISEVFNIDFKDISNEEINIFKISKELKIKWNTLEISDESEFFTSTLEKNTSDTFHKWWSNLPDYKKNLYKKTIIKAVSYQNYREYTRILMIKNLSLLRDLLLEKSLFSNKKNVYFHTIDEITNNKFDENLCIERKKEYEKYDKYSLPNKLTLNYINDKKENLWISAWIVQWILLEEKDISIEKWDIILYTKILSPDLTKYFPKIKWIISEKWGYLSHLSIIARENKVPVIISTKLNNIKIGDLIEINWSNWEIKKIEV